MTWAISNTEWYENVLNARLLILALTAGGLGFALLRVLRSWLTTGKEGVRKITDSLFKPVPHEAVAARFERSPSAERWLEDILHTSPPSFQPSTPAIAKRYAFICYSHDDEAYVKKLTASLLERGLEFWVDWLIPDGATWNQVIKERIESAGAFIIVMTPSAEASGRVQAEMELALRCELDPFPLLLEGDPIFGINHIEFHDVRDGSAPGKPFFSGLAAALNSADVRRGSGLPPDWPRQDT